MLTQYIALIEKVDPQICVCVTDTDLDAPGPIIQFVNKRWEEATGHKSEEVVGKFSPRILQGAKSSRETLTRLKEALRRGEPFEGETINYRKDGAPVRMAWIAIAKVVNSTKYFVALQRVIGNDDDPLEQLRLIKQIESNILDKLNRMLPLEFVRKSLDEPSSDGS